MSWFTFYINLQLLKALDSSECTKHPYMSPGLAPDEMLIGLPPVHIIVSTHTLYSCSAVLPFSISLFHHAKCVYST